MKQKERHNKFKKKYKKRSFNNVVYMNGHPYKKVSQPVNNNTGQQQGLQSQQHGSGGYQPNTGHVSQSVHHNTGQQHSSAGGFQIDRGLVAPPYPTAQPVVSSHFIQPVQHQTQHFTKK